MCFPGKRVLHETSLYVARLSKRHVFNLNPSEYQQGESITMAWAALQLRLWYACQRGIYIVIEQPMTSVSWHIQHQKNRIFLNSKNIFQYPWQSNQVSSQMDLRYCSLGLPCENFWCPSVRGWDFLAFHDVTSIILNRPFKIFQIVAFRRVTFPMWAYGASTLKMTTLLGQTGRWIWWFTDLPVSLGPHMAPTRHLHWESVFIQKVGLISFFLVEV